LILLQAVILAVAALLLWRLVHRRWPPAAAAAFPLLLLRLPSIVLAVAYVVWNISSFGTWLPISGRVKLHWVGMLSMGQRFEALIEIPWVGHRLLTRALSAAGAPALAVSLAGLLLVALGAALWLGRRSIGAAVADSGAQLIVFACAAMFLLDHLLIGPVQGDGPRSPFICSPRSA
jgi:hypothetical protein